MAHKQSNSRGTGAGAVKPIDIDSARQRSNSDASGGSKDEGGRSAEKVEVIAGQRAAPAQSVRSAQAASGGASPEDIAPAGEEAAAHRAPRADAPGGGQNVPATGSPARPHRGAALHRKHPVARARVPANDDTPSIGGLVYALQQRPSRSPFLIAAIASAVWVILGFLVGWAVMERQSGEIGGVVDFLSNPALIGVFAGTVIPPAVFWFLAFLIWRAQELRLMSSAMTEVAVRLAEPDKLAEQSVASLGQIVRRQVVAMNEAISRALGRAGELEALVHNEVTALERSYSENEHRIRSLINELASEREALENHSNRVSKALRGIGGDVRREIVSASDQAARSLSEATSSLSDTLANRAQKITAAVTAAGTAIDEKLAERGALITEQLAKHGAKTADALHQSGLQVTAAIQQASDRASAAISAKSNSLVHSVITMSERVAQEIPALLDRLGGEQKRLNAIINDAAGNLSALESALAEKTSSLESVLTDRTKVLQTVLSDHARAIDTSLLERTQALEAILGQRAQEFHHSLAAGGKKIETSIAERAKALEAALAQQSGSIRHKLEEHAEAMEKSLARQTALIERSVTASSRTIERAVEELAERSGESSHALESQAEILRQVSGGLLNQIQGLTKRFEEQGNAIMKAAKSFEVSNTRIDTIMESRQAQLAKMLHNITERADQLDKMMHSYSNMLEQSLSQAEARARNVTQVLARDSEEKSQAAIQEIERLRREAQAQTARAIEELKGRFGALSDQIGEQLNNLTSRFSETSQTLQDSTRRAAVELESTQSELRRQAQAIPETTRESASAMRKALQDQLAALNSLSSLAERHRYSVNVSRPERKALDDMRHPRRTPQSGPFEEATSSRSSGEPESGFKHGDFEPRYRNPALPNNPDWQREPDRKWDEPLGRVSPPGPSTIASGGQPRPVAPSSERLDAVTASLLQRFDKEQRDGVPDDVDAASDRGSAQSREVQAAEAGKSDSPAGDGPARGQWSVGDLLARASEPDDLLGDGGDDYGRPPVLAPRDEVRPQEQAAVAKPADSAFNMKDIADAVDHATVLEVWKRYNRGERSVISRDVYNRQGQITFDRVRRHYRDDPAFRHVADRYMADFEKVLKDASKAHPGGGTVHQYLTSETGRIYLMLAHASGRLG